MIVVDVQNCFIDGSLALINSPAHQDGAEVVPIINHLIRETPFDVIVYTYDWHPSDHISFIDNLESRRQYLEGNQNRTIKVFDKVIYTGPKFRTEQVLWPSHCIQKTSEAKLHKDIIVLSVKKIIIKKGTDPDIDSYSAFKDNKGNSETELDNKLQEKNVTRVFVAGLATDYCVSATARDAFNLNYTTYLIRDASRGISVNTIESELNNLKRLGVGIIDSRQVRGLIDSGSGKSIGFLWTVSINLLVLLVK